MIMRPDSIRIDTIKRHSITSACRGFAGDARGIAAVEMAIVLPVFLAMMIFIFEVSRALYTKVELQYAVNQAIRTASMDRSANSASLQAKIGSKMILLDSTKLTSVVLTDGATNNGVRTSTLNVNYQFKFMLPYSKPNALNFSEQATFIRR